MTYVFNKFIDCAGTILLCTTSATSWWLDFSADLLCLECLLSAFPDTWCPEDVACSCFTELTVSISELIYEDLNKSGQTKTNTGTPCCHKIGTAIDTPTLSWSTCLNLPWLSTNGTPSHADCDVVSEHASARSGATS